MTNKIILITGVSSGLGRAFAEAALREGHTVVGTVRTEEARKAFEALEPERAKSLILEVTDFAAIARSVSKIKDQIGPVDVLVNNAGYGHEGILEEASLEEMRHQFEVNVFGAVALMKAVLPTMRKRRSGHIINITSMGGYITMPGIAYYCGSKFALEGVSKLWLKKSGALVFMLLPLRLARSEPIGPVARWFVRAGALPTMTSCLIRFARRAKRRAVIRLATRSKLQRHC